MDGIIRMFASEQQIWLNKIRSPRRIQNVDIVVCRHCVDVRIQPLIFWRRWIGSARSVASRECRDEKGKTCKARYRGVKADAAERAHGTKAERRKLVSSAVWDVMSSA